MGKKKKDKTQQRKRKKEKEEKYRKEPGCRLLNSQAELYGCWINQEWNTSGVAYIVIARKMVTGLLMFAKFWLDMVKETLTHCSTSVNYSVEKFHREVIHREGSAEFFNASLEMVKELLSKIQRRAEEREDDLPEEYYHCLKLVGSLDGYVESAPVDVRPTEMEGHEGPCMTYKVMALEIIETELRQLPMLEESEDSNPEQKIFIWRAQEKKKPFFCSQEETLAVLILEGNNLRVEFYEEEHRKYLNNALLQYLGSGITLE